MVDTVTLYLILKKLLEPFHKWDAYKLGLIDKEGNKLREPVKAKELAAWDLLTKFVWNFKKLLVKVVGKSNFATYVTTAYLLKDSLSVFYINHNKENLNETLLEDFTYSKQGILVEVLGDLPKINTKINEKNFEFYFLLSLPRVEKLLEKIDERKFLC